jgi:Ca2+-binding RTX toxin-like protein
LATVGPAQAATVTKSAPDEALYVTIEYIASAGEPNALLVEALSTPTQYQITFRDGGAVITPLGGCVASSANEVTCTVGGSYDPVIKIRTGDLDDSVTVSASSRNDVSTEISGGDGNDVLAGGPGADTFIADPGSDAISGGGSFDTLTYRDRSEPVFVSLDSVANDGAIGERDLVGSGIELVSGGRGGDTLIGGASREFLSGNEGNDTIYGGAGADDLGGGSGQDVIDAGAGRDYVDGGSGHDRLLGGLGNDILVGMRGKDNLSGGAGSDGLRGGPGADRAAGGADRDLLLMKDGYVDRVIGGSGRDRAEVDRRLDRVSGVERLA